MLDNLVNYFADFDGAVNSCRTVALWICIALLVCFVTSRLYVFSLEKSGRVSRQELSGAIKIFNGGWIIAALIIAFAFIVTFTACYFVDVTKGEDTLVPILFYPLLVLCLAVAVSAALIFFMPKKVAIKIVCAAVTGCAFISVIVCMTVYYASGQAGDAYSSLGLYLSSAMLAAGVVVFAVLADRAKRAIDTRAVTFGAVCVALSFALSYVRIFKLPMGGSITFASMLPLMLFAYMFGSRKGVLVGAIYGVLQAVQDPWILHPAQFLLDYIIAFAAIGLTGCMRDLGALKGKMRAQFAVGAVIACAVRFAAHYFAGVFAFGEYGAGYAVSFDMPSLANAYFYSFVYQCMYIIPELIIVLAASMLAFASRSFRKQIELYADGKKPVEHNNDTDPQNNNDSEPQNNNDTDPQDNSDSEPQNNIDLTPQNTDGQSNT